MPPCGMALPIHMALRLILVITLEIINITKTNNMTFLGMVGPWQILILLAALLLPLIALIDILKSKFEEIKKNFNENYDLSDEIFKFLATEITTSIREMVGALNRVLAFSKINTKSPNIYECKKILKKPKKYTSKDVSPLVYRIFDMS